MENFALWSKATAKKKKLPMIEEEDIESKFKLCTK